MQDIRKCNLPKSWEMNAETYLDQVKKLDSMVRNRRRDYARRAERIFQGAKQQRLQ